MSDGEWGQEEEVLEVGRDDLLMESFGGSMRSVDVIGRCNGHALENSCVEEEHELCGVLGLLQAFENLLFPSLSDSVFLDILVA